MWMMFGVSFYSFLVGSITSILAAATRDTDTLQSKLRHLEEFANASGIEDELYIKIRTFLLNNYTELYSKYDEQNLV